MSKNNIKKVVILSIISTLIIISINTTDSKPQTTLNWETGPSLVIGDAGHAHTYNGKIIFIGGSAVQEFDPERGNWTIINNGGLGYQPYRGGSIIIGDKIYLAHGWTSEKTTIYDITNNKFTTFAKPPSNRLDVAIGSINGTLYISGGWVNGDTTSLTLTEAFNPEDEAWFTIDPMNTGRKQHEMVELGNQLYAIGGFSGFGFNTITEKVERFDPVINKWEYITDIPSRFEECGSTTIGNNRIVISNIRKTAILNLEENLWRVGDFSMESIYMANSLASINETIFSIGARDAPGNYYNIVWTLDASKISWEQETEEYYLLLAPENLEFLIPVSTIGAAIMGGGAVVIILRRRRLNLSSSTSSLRSVTTRNINTCTQCGKINLFHYTFCIQCGNKL